MDNIAKKLVKDGHARDTDIAKVMVTKYLECTVANGIEREVLKIRMIADDIKCCLARPLH